MQSIKQRTMKIVIWLIQVMIFQFMTIYLGRHFRTVSIACSKTINSLKTVCVFMLCLIAMNIHMTFKW